MFFHGPQLALVGLKEQEKVHHLLHKQQLKQQFDNQLIKECAVSKLW